MKIRFNAVCCVPDDVLARNMELSVGYPEPSGSGHLAVVGGGPDVRYYLDELRTFRGDIWAINGAWRWLTEHGVADAMFYTTDPSDRVPPLCKGAPVGVFAAHCHPDAFKAVGTAYRDPNPPEKVGGPTSAVAAAGMAVRAGYTKVTWYGCEGSYRDRSHAYMHHETGNRCEVVSDGKTFLAEAELVCQSEWLMKIINLAPHVFQERSGGLLRAMLRSGDWDITRVSPQLKEAIRAEAKAAA